MKMNPQQLIASAKPAAQNPIPLLLFLEKQLTEYSNFIKGRESPMV